MAKLRNNPLTANDLSNFIATESDFAFELQVLNSLRTDGIECQHGGTYIDPVTSKPRQFDIRARAFTECYWLYLAIECKHLKPNYPLLVHCVPRLPAESHHGILQSRNHNPTFGRREDQIHGQVMLSGPDGIFRRGESVGKVLDQVGRTLQDDLIGGDRESFDKWTQAVASAEWLVREAYDAGAFEMQQIMLLSFICPILVVPNATLWQVDYSDTGAIQIPPRQVDQSNLYIDRETTITAGAYSMDYRLSHLVIVTLGRLCRLIHEWSDEGSSLTTVFPTNVIQGVLGMRVQLPSAIRQARERPIGG
jgi:hypothetical protein